jgi:hypothetical protein
MKNTKVALIVFSIMTVLLASCAEKEVEKNIEKKISQETQINTQADLNLETNQLLENMKGVTETQRAELIALREKTRLQSQDLTKESLRMRSVLIKELLSTHYNQAEVSLIKNKIKKTDEKKLNIFLEAVTASNKILGRENRRRETDFETMYISHDFMY